MIVEEVRSGNCDLKRTGFSYAANHLVELGRMKTVGGQEDMILDVAWRMSRKGEAHG